MINFDINRNRLISHYKKTLQKFLHGNHSAHTRNKLVKRLAKFEQKLHLPVFLNRSNVFASLLIAGMIMSVHESKAQTFSGPEINPFGLSTPPYPYFLNGSPELTDIDNDGDADLFLGNNPGDILFYENTGTATDPQFSTYVINPFGLTFTGIASFPDFADLDNDGDFDMLTSTLWGTYYYFENNGTADAPSFELPVTDPFGLVNDYMGYSESPEFADLDGDGDFDMLTGGLYDYLSFPIYFENTGTPEDPFFTAPVVGPFNLNNVDCGPAYYSNYAAGDYDHDGDFDMVVGYDNSDLCFIENTGSPDAPYFENGTVLIADIDDETVRTSFNDLDGDGDIDLLIFNQGGYDEFNYFENTDCNLTVPDSLFVSGIAGTSATLNWSPYDPNYQFGVQVYDITTATVVKKIITADNATTVTGLSAGHNYGWKVWTVCPDFKTRRGPSEIGYFSIPMRAGIFPTADLIYPNPSSGTITIHLEGLNSENRILNIYNMTGELINQMQLPDELINISVDTELPAGQYLMIVRDDANSISQLISITR